MGICASCLGLSSESNDKTNNNDEHGEASPLIDPRQRQEAANYGSRGVASENAIHDLLPSADPEQEAEERDYLSNVWRHTSDKLIDITQLTSTSSNAPSQTDPEATNTSVNYERIFQDTFPRRPYSSGRPSIKPDTFTPPSSSGNGKQNGAPIEGGLDLTAVHKIGKPLIINFDEIISQGSDENERSAGGVGGQPQPLKQVIS